MAAVAEGLAFWYKKKKLVWVRDVEGELREVGRRCKIVDYRTSNVCVEWRTDECVHLPRSGRGERERAKPEIARHWNRNRIFYECNNELCSPYLAEQSSLKEMIFISDVNLVTRPTNSRFRVRWPCRDLELDLHLHRVCMCRTKSSSPHCPRIISRGILGIDVPCWPAFVPDSSSSQDSLFHRVLLLVSRFFLSFRIEREKIKEDKSL